MRDWLSHRVVASPDEVALVRAEDGEAWTYADLDRLVSETAGRLAAHGVCGDDRVGVLTPPYVGTVGMVHAMMRIGATFVPLGEGLTPRELSERVERADLDVVVCAESTESQALSASDQVPVLSVDEPSDDAVTAIHGTEPAPVDPADWAFDDRLCVLFTSGTTGAAKPVPLTAGNVYASGVASAFRLGVDPDDRWLVSLALHHMGGLAPVYRSALYGTTLVLRKGFDPGGAADDIDRYNVTGVSLVPTMLKRMLDRRGTLAESLRVVLLGGAPAPDELIERCRDYSIPVYPTYGMTEAASQVATATPQGTRGRIGTVGRPLFGTDVTVVDEDGTPVAPGETGEIVVDGPTITPGYLGSETTGSEFGPYGLHTGDVGRIDEDGYLYVFNRLDDRILSGGQNVEPGEVAGVLVEHPAIEDVAVVGIDDDEWGERVAALIEVTDSNELTVSRSASDETERQNGDDAGESERQIEDETLVTFARERLAAFKIPKTVAYTDELPRTVSGTIDREAVRDRLVEEGHDPRDGFGSAGFEPAEPESAGVDAGPPAGSTALGGGVSEPSADLEADGIEPKRAQTDLTAEVFTDDDTEEPAEPEGDAKNGAESSDRDADEGDASDAADAGGGADDDADTADADTADGDADTADAETADDDTPEPEE